MGCDKFDPSEEEEFDESHPKVIKQEKNSQDKTIECEKILNNCMRLSFILNLGDEEEKSFHFKESLYIY